MPNAMIVVVTDRPGSVFAVRVAYMYIDTTNAGMTNG